MARVKLLGKCYHPLPLRSSMSTFQGQHGQVKQARTDDGQGKPWQDGYDEYERVDFDIPLASQAWLLTAIRSIAIPK